MNVYDEEANENSLTEKIVLFRNSVVSEVVKHFTAI
jgi:hypothetical protein